MCPGTLIILSDRKLKLKPKIIDWIENTFIFGWLLITWLSRME